MDSNIAVNNWAYKDSHIQSGVNQNSFMSAAKTIVYAAPNTGGTDVDTLGTFSPIGVLQGYNWQENRQIEMIFEIGSELPYLIPGRTTGQISLSRMLLYGVDLTNVLCGTDASSDPDQWIKTLKDISNPFNLMFAAFGNANAQNATTPTYSRVFRNCWIQARSESVTAGQIIIAENVNIMYQDIPSVKISVNS